MQRPSPIAGASPEPSLTGKRIGIGTATHMAIDEYFSDSGEPSKSASEAPQKVDPIDELKRIIGELE